MHSNGLSDQTCYGIGYDDPSLTPASKCRYDACVEVPAHFVASGQVDIQSPAGRPLRSGKVQRNPRLGQRLDVG